MRSFNENNKSNVARVLENILDPNNNTPENIRRRVIKEMLWSATADYQGLDDHKYKLPIWSDDAINLYQNGLFNGRNRLRHEHIIPKNLIINNLTNMQYVNMEQIYQLLHRFAHGAVVTKEEDKKLDALGLRQAIPIELPQNTLPLQGDYLEILFSRYIEAGINLRFVRFNGNEIIPTDNYYVRNNNVEVNHFIDNIDFDEWVHH